MVVSNNKLFHCLSHDVITCDEDCDLLTAYWWSSSSNGVGYSCITIYIMAIWCDWQILIPNVPVSSGFPRGLTLSCFLAGLMLYQSPVVFLDCWYPCFRNFDSIIPVDVIRVKSFCCRHYVQRALIHLLRRAKPLWTWTASQALCMGKSFLFL